MKYSIENDFLKVTADSFGAELMSVINKKTGEEMMWQGNPEIWDGHCPMLFPYCGKLKNNRYILDGKEYTSPKHGFIKNYDHELFSNEKDKMHFIAYSNEETRKLFPRDFTYETIYSLKENKLIQQVIVTNKSNKELRFGLGFHPAFNMPFNNDKSTKDYEIQFEIPQTPVVKDNFTSGPNEGLVSGKTYQLVKNSCVIPLNDNMFDADSICLSQLTAKTISLVEKDTGKKITVDIEGFPYVLLWSMGGKGSLKFLCIEPWLTVQDTGDASGNWNNKACAAELAPEESWHKELNITFYR